MLPLDIEVHQALDVDQDGVPVGINQDMVGSEFSVDQPVCGARTHPIGQFLQTVAQCGVGRRDATVAPRRLLKVPQGTVEDPSLARDLGHGSAPLQQVHPAVALALVSVHHLKHLGEVAQGSRLREHHPWLRTVEQPPQPTRQRRQFRVPPGYLLAATPVIMPSQRG
ncbi:hypothetical protein ACH4VM_39535 [Streptomyces sp. NPDC020792]|uniref:hypothetical protein n=1 Tax=Streptomyces sp. NPDC020792 TaxID=3365089 RepID=UPI0037B23817